MTFSSYEFEGDDFGRLFFGFDLGDNGGAFYEGAADEDAAIIADQENLVEAKLGAGGECFPLDGESLSGFNAVLFAAVANYGVHLVYLFRPPDDLSVEEDFITISPLLTEGSAMTLTLLRDRCSICAIVSLLKL